MNICFIGGGNMAAALIGGLLSQGFPAGAIGVVEINPGNRERLLRDFGVRAVEGLKEGVEGSGAIVLAVKPQQLHQLLLDLAPLLKDQLLISIAAGIRSVDIARWAGTRSVVRAMPNTPALIRSGITGMYALPEASPEHREQAQRILSAVGEVLWLHDEAMMDSITAISGSGPAYVFYMMEALQQAAVELGFSGEDARKLSLATFLGASRLASDSHDAIGILREKVTSKNGTTERALLSMEANHVKQHIVDAAKAAALRSRELGDELGRS